MKKTFAILLLLAVMKMSAQVVPTFFPRKFLLEHFTSANCNQCPMGMKYIVEYLDRQTTPYIWVSHHAVYGTDEYTIPASNAIAMNYLGMNTVPSVVFNRSKQDGLMVIGAWDIENLVVEDDTVAEASVMIEHQYDAATRRLDITVSGQVANMDRTAYLLSILIKENGLVGKQEDAYCSWKGKKWKEYMHPRVVRDFVTATFGDTVEIKNHTYTYTTNYTLSSDWVAENCCVVAYLTPLEKKPIINAEQVPLVVGTQGGEEYEPYGITEGAGPSESINFDSLQVKKLANNQLEFTFTSTKTMKSYAGICKQVGLVYVNAQSDVLSAGTYPIQEDNEWGTITAGYRIDEEETLGGSRLVYSLSTDLKEGIITPIHMWRMSSGEMILDKDGNISLVFTTYNGTTVSATAVYDFSPAQGDDTQGSGFQEAEQPTLQGTRGRKVVRNGQLLIEIQGVWYSALGYKVSE